MNDNLSEASSPKPGIKPLIVVAIVIIVSIAGIFAYNEFLKPEPALVTATISIDYGNGTVISEEIGSDNNTALGLLITYAGSENVIADAGFVSSINGIAIVDDVPGLEGTEARYWMFYVNGTPDLPLPFMVHMERENPVHVFLRDSTAGIGDLNENIFLRLTGFYFQRSSVW